MLITQSFFITFLNKSLNNSLYNFLNKIITHLEENMHDIKIIIVMLKNMRSISSFIANIFNGHNIT